MSFALSSISTVSLLYTSTSIPLIFMPLFNPRFLQFRTPFGALNIFYGFRSGDDNFPSWLNVTGALVSILPVRSARALNNPSLTLLTLMFLIIDVRARRPSSVRASSGVPAPSSTIPSSPTPNCGPQTSSLSNHPTRWVFCVLSVNVVHSQVNPLR